MPPKKPFTKSVLTPLAAIVSDPSVKSKGIYAYHSLTQIRRQWDECIGGKVKEFCFPYKFSNGTLYTAVADSIWYTELKLIKNDILAKLNAVNGEIVDIRFKLTDEKLSISEQKGKKTPQERILAERELKVVEETAELIKDEKLREVFRNAMRRSISLI
ncbi:MAG: DUF721 domain-containing protein [Deferribacteraceae bacterium]|jgi:hypothetical protein|nr:DUF721 domain-containing protein [Deferribacteraceae bacterium]